jgi:L-gulonate 5-dehydrogenase
MLSVVVEQPNRIAVLERPQPQPGPGEVRVRVRFAGICGSDVHILHGKNPFVVYPRVIGHEFVGRIDAVGDGVDAARVGEMVAVDPVVSCGHCHACMVGRRNVCHHLQVIGVHRDGGFAEYMCAPAPNAYPIPARVQEAAAAIIEPFAVAANVTGRTGVHPSDTALIYGAGPVGLNLLQTLRGVYGVRALITDRIDQRLELARACGAGADDVINTAREPLAEALARRGLERGPTLIFDAVGHPSILEEAVAIAAPAGRIGVLGFSTHPSAIVQQELTRKELTLYASRLNCAMFPRVIEWIAKGLVHPERIITHRIGFRDVVDAFEVVERNPEHACKVLLEFDRDV